MREILFRGKRVDNGEWIEGYLLNAKWYLDDSPQTMIFPPNATVYPGSEISYWEDVIPETVDQFTELLDIEGHKIFEGDIMKTAVTGLTPHTGVVEFLDGAFGLKCTDGNAFFLCFIAENYKIIGNVHDQPELMEVPK